MTNLEAFELAKINPELEDYVLKDMPQNLNKVQKTIYVYTKLCSILNYDPEYSSSGKSFGKKQEVHANITNVEHIGLDNTDVICYDFNIIFGKFLKKFDVNFAIKGYSEKSNIYGNHSDLYVEFDEDDLKDIASYGKVVFLGYTDMKHLKVDHKLLTKASSESDKTFSDYFLYQKQKMIDLVLEQDEKEKQSKQTFNENDLKIKELERKFIAACPDFVETSEAEAVDMFVSLTQKVNMNRHDASFYLQKIFENVVPKNSDKLFTYSILKEQNKKDPELFNMISIFNIASDDQDFFLKITPPHKIERISKENLQKAFDQGKIDYIEEMFPAKAILPNIYSKTVDDLFGRSICNIRNSKQTTIKDMRKKIKELEAEDSDLKFPDIRLWKYATNFARTKTDDATAKSEAPTF